MRPASLRPITFRWLLLLAVPGALACSKESPTALMTVTAPASPEDGQPPLASPRMGSGGYAFAYGSAWPGAEVPNGMMRVGPDTYGPYGNFYALHFSGYWAGDNTVLAFSHMHLHGTGSQDYGVLGVLPLVNFTPGQLSADAYKITFQSKNETAWPGYYALTLDSGVKAEFTATTHAALERFTYPASSTATLLIDLNHHLENDGISAASLTLVPEQQEIQGSLHTSGGMSGGYPLFYVMRFQQPWTGAQVWSGTGPAATGTTASGTGGGAALTFNVSNGTPVEVQVGLSLVSQKGAAANLSSELTTWDFDTVRAAAVAAWNKRLNAVIVHAPASAKADLQTFYSALHHAFVMPGVYSDDDDTFNYLGTNGSAAGFQFMTDISGWDVYRSLAPLYDLLAPDIAANVVSSLYTMDTIAPGPGQDGDYPKWPLAANDSGSMIGSAADVILSDAYVKGIHGIDGMDAYQRLRAAALDQTMPAGQGRGGRGDGWQDYLQYGYVLPADGAVVSLTCEYNQDDFALSNFANALGQTSDAQTLVQRSTGYRHLYDPATGFLRGRNADGSLMSDMFSASNFGLSAEYVEADAYQSEFCAIWDVDGLATLWGGKAQLATGLEQLFENTRAERAADITAAALAAKQPGSDPNLDAINLPPEYYFAGNEPDIHYANIFALAGRPDLTQKWMPWIRETYFSSATNGLPGNDDGGTMSAWYVWSSLGIAPIPGSDIYILGSPAFPEADVQVQGGTFKILANGVSATNIYVQSAKLNGAALNTAVIHHSDLKAGGTLVLVMGSKPSNWARSN